MIVGTWNVENLFSPGTEFGTPDPAVFDAKIAGLAAAIAAQDLDVVAVQEVGDEPAFAKLLDALGAQWHGALSTHFETPHTIRVGFLSRSPFLETSEHYELPRQLQGIPTDDAGTPLREMGRGALRVRVSIDGTEVDLVSVHLKSKLISYPDNRFQPKDEGERARYAAYALMRRAAEATAVRQFADELLDGHGNDRAVIVMGDCNDEVNAATTQILNGPSGSEIGTKGASQPDKGDAYRLFNLAPLIPEAERYSRVFRGRRELIDQVFVSNVLRPRITSVATRTGGAPLPSITEDPNARRNTPVSDHAMIVTHVAL